uniref:Uncharacterized protein n=1 Tax=Anguilla anguilla TaxID=7936 RepID=A0A0E9T5R6_ANGAN
MDETFQESTVLVCRSSRQQKKSSYSVLSGQDVDYWIWCWPYISI